MAAPGRDNVVEPRLSIITDIALDHQSIWVNRRRIAREKADIRRDGVVVTLPQLPRRTTSSERILDAGARS